MRRATFQFLLDIASQTQRHSVEQNTFRQLVYFGASADGAIYEPAASVDATHRGWRLYQAREYYAFALNAMWYHLCDWGIEQAGEVRPVPLSRLWQYIEESLNLDRLAERLKLRKPHLTAQSGFQQLLEWIQGVVGASESQFDSYCRFDSPIQEDRLYNLANENRTEADVMIAGMVVMLALVYLRFGGPNLGHKPEWSIALMGADRRLSLDGFVKELRRRLKSGPITVEEIVRWLYTDYIILQHQLVATSKLPENTFRFQREGDHLRFFYLENPLGFTDSRYFALSTTIHELGLCGDVHQSTHRLTTDGKELLAQGDLS